MLLHTSSPDVSVPNPILFLLLGPQQLNMTLITKHGLLSAFTVYYLFVLHKLYGHAYCQNISTFCFLLFYRVIPKWSCIKSGHFQLI